MVLQRCGVSTDADMDAGILRLARVYAKDLSSDFRAEFI